MFKLLDEDCEIRGKSHGKEAFVRVLFWFLTLRQLQELAQQYTSMLCLEEQVEQCVLLSHGTHRMYR